ncbi:MAG: hypothetical protein ACRD2P_07750 [Terriglobia bacterium]
MTDLLATLQELEHLSVGFISLAEVLDLTTSAAGILLLICSRLPKAHIVLATKLGTTGSRGWHQTSLCDVYGFGWLVFFADMAKDAMSAPVGGVQVYNAVIWLLLGSTFSNATVGSPMWGAAIRTYTTGKAIRSRLLDTI